MHGQCKNPTCALSASIGSCSPSLHFQVPLGTTPVSVEPLGGRLLPLAAYSATGGSAQSNMIGLTV